MSRQNVYSAIIARLFRNRYKRGMKSVPFEREELVSVARALRIDLPKNLGDIVYSFRYRAALPKSVQKTAETRQAWIIRPAGRGKYAFAMVTNYEILPTQNLTATKIPDATPGMVAKYAINDEQALLARLRYNRLVDIFSSVTCYSLQNHLRTTVPEMGQVETDEIYVGVDKKGIHYVFPVQAKGGTDRLGVVQIEQDFAVCAKRFASLVCRPLAAQFMDGGVIALFEFTQTEEGVKIAAEKHYQLLPPDQVTEADLQNYRKLAQG